MSNAPEAPRSNDPFEHALNGQPIKANEARIPWEQIPPDQISACKRLGVRASALVRKHASDNPQRHIVVPHPIICSMEFALVHLHRPLRLQAFEETDDLTFMAEYLKIAQNIDREKGKWNTNVPLQFYDSSLRTLMNWLKMPMRR